MKNVVHSLLVVLLFNSSLIACKKEADSANQSNGGSKYVTGEITDLKGNKLSGAKVVIEHTVWFDSHVDGITDANGDYKVVLPSEPAGNWTAKAQVSKTAYGQNCVFDLAPDNTDPFNGNNSTVRNFTWKLSGPRPTQGSYYGAHVDLYQFGSDIQMDKVKLIFTPYPGEEKLIDGSPNTTIERNVEDVAGTFMVKDIPVGKYLVKAVYPGKTLLLDNRHDEGEPAVQKTVVFGKYGNLAETEYNIEFWLSE